jgi:hypothetical protein
MVERTEIEKHVRKMISIDILCRPLKSFGEKGIRSLDKLAKNTSDLLEQGKDIGDRVNVEIKELEEKKARTLKEGIDEYSEKHPQQGKELKRIIAEKRKKRNKYLVYGLEEDYKLGEEDYIKVMINLGFSSREAAAIYSHILNYSERMGKAYENTERKILLKK